MAERPLLYWAASLIELPTRNKQRPETHNYRAPIRLWSGRGISSTVGILEPALCLGVEKFLLYCVPMSPFAKTSHYGLPNFPYPPSCVTELSALILDSPAISVTEGPVGASFLPRLLALKLD